MAHLDLPPCRGLRDFYAELGEPLRPRQAPEEEVKVLATLPLMLPESEPGACVAVGIAVPVWQCGV